MSPHSLSSLSILQLTKPSPLSSADNAPRSLHLNAVQAVHTHYSSPTSYTHAPPTLTAPSRSQSYIAPSSSANSSTATLTSPATAAPATGHKLRRMPAGANLAEYRQQQAQHHHHHHHPSPPHQHARSQSLSSIPNKTASSSNNSNNSRPPSANNIAAMSSINAITAGPGPNNAPPPAGHPPHGRFDGPRSPPSEFANSSPICFYFESSRVAVLPDNVNASTAHPTSPGATRLASPGPHFVPHTYRNTFARLRHAVQF